MGEIYEYKNLGQLKNYVGSFSSNVKDSIDKTRKKVGLIFASNFDRTKVNEALEREALETGVFTIITVRGGALDAYSDFIAKV